MLGMKFGSTQQAAVAAHSGRREGFEHGHRLRPLGDHQQALVLDRDAGLRGHFLPDVARAHCAVPAGASLLAGDGDEAEIAYRGADRLRLPVDDGDGQTAPPRCQRMGQADDAGTDDDEIELAGQRLRHAWVLSRSRDTTA